MWAWLASLPLGWQISIIVLVIAAVAGIAIFGNFVFKGGGPIVKIGNASKARKKRSCGDCIVILMGKREMVQQKKNFILNNVLKEQMNFVEQKLIEIKTMLLQSYREDLVKRRTGEPDRKEETKQYRLYQGQLMVSLENVKDEIRRSFKENGFEDLSGNEFSSYVKEKAAVLFSMGSNFLGDMYPYEGMIVPWEERSAHVKETFIHRMEDMCFELYQKAKDVKRSTKVQLDNIDQDFATEIDDFLGTSHEIN